MSYLSGGIDFGFLVWLTPARLSALGYGIQLLVLLAIMVMIVFAFPTAWFLRYPKPVPTVASQVEQ